LLRWYSRSLVSPRSGKVRASILRLFLHVDESNCISFLVKLALCTCVDSLCSLEMMRRTNAMRRTRKMCQILKIQWRNI
jgi:hypothetical protein